MFRYSPVTKTAENVYGEYRLVLDGRIFPAKRVR